MGSWESERLVDIKMLRNLPASAGVWALVGVGWTSESPLAALVSGVVCWIAARGIISALWDWCIERTGVPIVDLNLWVAMRSHGCMIPMVIAASWPVHVVGVVVLGVRLSHLGWNPLLVGLVLALCFLTSIVLVGK